MREEMMRISKNILGREKSKSPEMGAYLHVQGTVRRPLWLELTLRGKIVSDEIRDYFGREDIFKYETKWKC